MNRIIIYLADITDIACCLPFLGIADTPCVVNNQVWLAFDFDDFLKNLKTKL